MAVSTIVARTRKLGTSWLLGAFWGLGHTITIFIVGVAIILFRVVIPTRLGLSMELSVGVMLVALGLWNLSGRGFGKWGVPHHSHPHVHDDPEHHHEILEDAHGHSHEHAHLREVELGWLPRIVRDAGSFQLLRSLAVGLVHGLAGSAAVALLVLSTIKDPYSALWYLLIFGGGTLAGMLILSTLMELAFLHAASAWLRLDRGLTAATGLLSLAFGLWVVYDMGIAHGLLSAHPQWTPQ